MHVRRFIQIRGARVHNLKNLNLDLPRNKLIVITGVSGSGKSSLAFDTLYAEGQRRYVESLSAYARQFLERMDRPDLDEIRGLSPAVAIEQKNPTKTSRSTVGTATEIHDYLRLLYARIGRTVCPQCGEEVKKDQVEDAVDRLFALPSGTRIQVTFPLHGTTLEEKALELADLKSRGFYRVVLDGEVFTFDALKQEQLKARRRLLVLVDRLAIRDSQKGRLADSLDLAFREGGGRVEVLAEDGRIVQFSQAFECPRCGIAFIEPQPRLFSFNNPFGACPTCHGFGEIIELDMNLVIPDGSKSLREGAIAPWNSANRSDVRFRLAEAARKHGIDMDRPWNELPEEHKRIVIEGAPPFPGIKGFFRRLERKKYKIGVRVFLSRYRGFIPCPDCHMMRLRPEALWIYVGGKHIGEVGSMSIEQARDFFRQLPLTDFEQEVARQILKELRTRLEYLVDVGLGYLTLDRRTQTLSGGEYQRINLATAVGFKLVGSLYVLDEPSIGLHPRDNARLIRILQTLRDLGNTVVVVEHDREMMQVSDELVDLGPLAGERGGEVVYQGSFDAIIKNGTSGLTAAYLKGEKSIPTPRSRRTGNGKSLRIVNACENNLKNITVEIPLGLLTVVTGVSGSGKSTLIHDVLYAALAKHFGIRQKRVGRHDRIEGVENIDGVVLVDQSPIGRTPRSNPVTYTKAFDGIRQLFAQTPRAKSRGFTPGTFSFNTPGGRCDRCEGAGVEKVEMQFLADIYLQCEVCGGKRFKKEVLDVKLRGKSIYDVLDLTIAEALVLFADVPKIANKLKLLDAVGLGYLRLGQP
ncbi:MAG: excinuclease ABC subunit A, partial [Calditrichaeota bacterium]